MSLKNTWTFTYTVAALLDAAQEQHAHHDRRLTYWADQEKQREDEARQTVSLAPAYDTIAGRSTIVQRPEMDSKALQYLHEAQERRKKHQQAVSDYGVWVTILASQDARNTLDLHYDDIVYFGIALPVSVEEREAE